MTLPTTDRPAEPLVQSTTKPTAVKSSATEPKRRTKPPQPPNKAARNPQKAPLARPGTKAAKILNLLQRPGGASLAELRTATGWQAHSVRGFLSGALKKKMGLRIHSGKRETGERVYRIPGKK